ncbi:MAG TPA: hypothetical protein VJT50_09120 [Pyrinomonadaceae bacterium]|nr:hypothetical protein [Pyrinomonadaceae bacterium]
MKDNLIRLLCAACLCLGCASLDASFAQRRRVAPKPRPNKQGTTRTQQTAQQPSTPPTPVLPDIRNDPDVQAADIAIIANITAKELRFDVVPNSTVQFFEKSKVQSIWHADRFNLPDRIEPGVTYRNIGIRLKIVSRLADIERIVAEALGETPIDQGTNSTPNTGPNTKVEPKPSPSPAVRRSPR